MEESHFASKNQLPAFYISGTLVENRLGKTKGFLTFSGCIEMEHWTKMDYGQKL